MSDENEKLIIIATHAAEDPDRCSLPFVMANASLAMDVECKVILQGDAVFMAMKDYAKHVNAHGFPPMVELMASYNQQGGRLYVCTPCLSARHITKEELLENAEQVTSGFVIDECTSATNVLTY